MSQSRRFGTPRPSGTHPQPIRTTHAHGNERFFPLPSAPGVAPYRISLAEVLGQAVTKQITSEGRLVFHMVGDTGGVKDPVPQTIVTGKLEDQLHTTDPST